MIEIIPAIDIIEGKCVRLYKGNYDQKITYSDNPVEIAKKIEDYGIKRLHLVDLDGAKQKEPINIKVLENIAKSTNLIIDFGGGIRKKEHLDLIFNAGANIVTIGSIAVNSPEIIEEWVEIYGGDKFIISADVRDERISINGWLSTTEISIFDFIDYYKNKGISKFLSTDINKDGTLKGPSFNLYLKLKKRHPNAFIIASGGVRDISDIIELNKNNIDGVIIGKALYENKITFEQLHEFINKLC